jgi:hypothetical protein
LRAVGFDLAPIAPGTQPDREPLPRSAFVVLAVGGPARQKWLDEFYVQAPTLSEAPESKLVLVDVGADWTALHAKYSDPGGFLILRGHVVATHAVGRREGEEWRGWLQALLPERIRVPVEMKPFVEARQPGTGQSHYVVTLCVGRLGQPWIESVRLP